MSNLAEKITESIWIDHQVKKAGYDTIPESVTMRELSRNGKLRDAIRYGAIVAHVKMDDLLSIPNFLNKEDAEFFQSACGTLKTGGSVPVWFRLSFDFYRNVVLNAPHPYGGYKTTTTFDHILPATKVALKYGGD